IARIYHPDDGRSMGLQGMINDMLSQCDFPTGINLNGEIDELTKKNPSAIARIISGAENYHADFEKVFSTLNSKPQTLNSPVLGITGTGGAGKSSLVDELVRRFTIDFKNKTVGIVSVDPSKKKTGGALLGDRIRMNSISNSRVYMRSLATRQSNLALSKHVQDAIDVLKAAKYDLIILETSGIGQSDTEITEHSDVSIYVMTPDYGAASQLEKIDMLDFADIIALNKFDKRGALDGLRDVKKQYKRNHKLFEMKDDDVPVFGTIASQFNDPGMNRLYLAVIDKLNEKCKTNFKSHLEISGEMSDKIYIIPPARIRYLSEITETIRDYNKEAIEQSMIANKLYALSSTVQQFESSTVKDKAKLIKKIEELYEETEQTLTPHNKKILKEWKKKVKRYHDEFFIYKVREKDIKIKTHSESLSHTMIPKVATPHYEAWGEILKWNLQENFPGEFPYTAGVFPFKREGEDPTRMFAGEGGPERTNRRFHYVSFEMPARRLSTAFDSVTLYGHDPDYRPDIYGKI
ncbi:MAG: hypothetical protein JJE25_14940, partial [Bacteroidia bacterium]|nr:hypothetical protein [Bacteroidia bacterium]